jgi:hypothetical protein
VCLPCRAREACVAPGMDGSDPSIPENPPQFWDDACSGLANSSHTFLHICKISRDQTRSQRIRSRLVSMHLLLAALLPIVLGALLFAALVATLVMRKRAKEASLSGIPEFRHGSKHWLWGHYREFVSPHVGSHPQTS